jgi:hypothetical protein
MPKRQRILLTSGLIGTISVAVVVFLTYRAFAHRVNSESVKRIEVGMTKNEVEALLGPATGYPANDASWRAVIDWLELDGNLEKNGWIGEDVGVVILFDQAGKVRQKPLFIWTLPSMA